MLMYFFLFQFKNIKNNLFKKFEYVERFLKILDALI